MTAGQIFGMKSSFVKNILNTLLIVFPSLTLGKDEFYIATAPDSIKFNTIEPLHSSDVADVFSAMLGYTLDKDVNWKSLAPVNPFKTPQALFVLEISGITNSLDLNLKGLKFPLENDGDLADQYDKLAFRTYHRFGDNTKPILLKLDAGDDLYSQKSEQKVLMDSVPIKASQRLKLALVDDELGQLVKDQTFNQSHEADAAFLTELETLKLFLEALVENKEYVREHSPDIYWLKLESFRALFEEHGADSYQAKEAYRIFEQLVGESVVVLDKVYNKQAVVSVLAYSDIQPVLTRKSRSLLAETTPSPITPPFQKYNLAHAFDPNFHIIFALVAFTTIVLILTVLGISVGIWFMDPGRDSIIYRMTSQRMKKE